jgi:selenocysteine-specific elongation factor
VIVATAGHVDHGKTALVRALTGVDTDRLPEEKRRGMSIDLGFAYLPQAGGEAIAFVDVPGHERFVRNMTAGVPGIDLALLVVAADDGPMPQTREHLLILEHLGAPRLLAVLSKVDRVAPERRVEAEAELRALVPDAEILQLSSVTGEGVDALRARLESVAKAIAPRASGQRFRLHVDRAFVIDGLGLVVTGTVASGAVAVGDDVQILPAGRKARVRSLRANNGEAARALAGQRCALALQGVSRDEVERGHIAVDCGPVPVSKHLDIEVAWFGAPLTRPRAAGVHLGTAMRQAHLSPHGRFARLVFPHDVSAWHGDRLLLRDPGTQRLIGAGTVVDSLPPARGAGRRERIAGLSAAAAFDALLADGMVDVDWFERVFHAAPREAPDLTAFTVRGVRHVMHRERWDALCGELERAVGEWHAAHPESIGPRPAEVGAPLAALVDDLVAAGRLRRDGPSLCLPGHRPATSAQDEALWEKVAPLLEGEDGKPPRVHELAAELALEPKAVTDFLQRAARAGRVHRVAPNRYFLPHAVQRLVELAVSLDEETAHRGFGAATFRDRCGLGRNLTIEVLEFLDSSGYTRRAGDLRRARKLSMEEKRPRWDARTSNPERGV